MEIICRFDNNELNEILKKNIRDVFDRFTLTEYKHGMKLNFYMRTDYDTPFVGTMVESINEGLIKTYPIDVTIRYICRFFNIKEGKNIWSKVDKNNIQKIYVKVPNYKEVLEALIHAFRLCGYHFENSVSKSFGINDGVGTITHCFAPEHLDDISNLLRQECKYLYHITPKYNESKIKSIGFSPRIRNKVFNFPDRVYFIKDNIDENALLGMAYQLGYYNDSKGNNGEYVIFKVDLNKVPNNTKFFYDPSYNNGVYTTFNIRPNCIVNIGYVDFKEENIRIKWNSKL